MRKGGEIRPFRRLAAMALLLTAAFILSWLEMLLSLPMPIPGIKIGLANIAILFTLYYLDGMAALTVLTGRLVLSALLFGNAAALLFSAAGGFLSFTVMCIGQRLFRRHLITVSILGGVFHNIGQLAAASAVLCTPLWWYLPYLIIGGIAAGAFNGWLVSRILRCKAFSDTKKSADKSFMPHEGE